MAPLAAVLPIEASKPATLNIPPGSRITVEHRNEARKASPRPAAAESVSPAMTSTPPAPGYTRVSSPPANDNGIYVESARPATVQTETRMPTQAGGSAPAICHDCGTVESVREIGNKGEGTGLGAIAGGVLGGLLGSQIGGGNGKKAMAVVGAAGGAFAGHEVEKRMRGEAQYEITVRFDDGRTRTYTETQAPQLQNGDRVRLANGRLTTI
jgi:outer membrane lipoprotein SlyB